MKNVYKKIKETRELKKFTQKEVSVSLGLVPASYNKIENGKTALTIENLQKIADFLGVSPQYLLFGGQEKENTASIEELDKLKQDLSLHKKLLKDAINTLLENAFHNSLLDAVSVKESLIMTEPTQTIENVAFYGKHPELFSMDRILLTLTIYKTFKQISSSYDLDYFFDNGFVNNEKIKMLYGLYKNGSHKMENMSLPNNILENVANVVLELKKLKDVINTSEIIPEDLFKILNIMKIISVNLALLVDVINELNATQVKK